MAGIYIHIPFCKQACHYCDFHFSTSLKYKEELLSALQKELILRKGYLKEQSIESIYLGGGTPSLLSASETNHLLDTIYTHFNVAPNPEITIEANPDDLTKEKVRELRESLINRFSIGVQSFFEEDLRWMNRAHNAQEAESAIKRVQDAGFENITADLIYGYPLLTNQKWINNIQHIIDLNIPHLSAYSMTIEPQTALASFINKGVQKPMNEGQSADQFLILTEMITNNGFEQYEISNYARNERYSKHNTNYWKGVPYLGIGPSAHSFDGTSRQWNIANNTKYISAIIDGKIPMEQEILTEADKFNEYIMTSLRTKWGIDTHYLNQHFPSEFMEAMYEYLPKYIGEEKIKQEENIYTLTQKGKLLADQIASEFFITN
ncbi:radical SAM family heme chaperone HemW [Albibacterium bauzanense]|uniref:Heme chaperone HemW n=1 Tax=Albibacterium bauzanense TaxID=653929 RepID=A0A4R1LWV2_9SPHI|nr:radical SAM family heme chaperone HemW [Albibacterium bauzanense]TCK83382.1 oxygen-independent coproporphyrinogen-3 oxidase [Albibacterium bauzanense]